MKWIPVILFFFLAVSAVLFRVSVENNSITVQDQPYGEIITVDRAVVLRRAKIVVVALSQYGLPTGQILGSSTLLKPGIYTSVDIELTGLSLSGESKIAQGGEVAAVLYDLTETHATDTPQKTLFGRVIAKRFRLL